MVFCLLHNSPEAYRASHLRYILPACCILLFASVSRAQQVSDHLLMATADDHVRLTVTPLFSDDGLSFLHALMYQSDEGAVPARVFVVAVPQDGEVSLSYDLSGGQTIPYTGSELFRKADNDAVLLEEPFTARGHRLVRVVLFPQQRRGDDLVTHERFDITLSFSGRPSTSLLVSESGYLDKRLKQIVINPDQFDRFMSPARSRAAKVVPQPEFDVMAEWVKVTVDQGGIMRVTGSDLTAAGITRLPIDSDSIRVYYGGGKTPPDDNSEPRPNLYQVSSRVEDGGDGTFDTNDRILFYAEEANRFEYEDGSVQYVKNYYDQFNYYWIAVGGNDGSPVLRWNTIDAAPTGAADETVTASRNRFRLERESALLTDSQGRIRDYFTWYWSADQLLSTPVNLPDLESSDSVVVRIDGYISPSGSTLRLNGITLDRVLLGGEYLFIDNSRAAIDGLNSLQLELGIRNGLTYLDWIDVDYSRRLIVGDDQLPIFSDERTGTLEFVVDNVPLDASVVDITDPDHPVRLTGLNPVGTELHFQTDVTAGSPSRYQLYADASLRAPEALELYTPGTLRTEITQYDGIVVGPRAFLDPMQEYVDYREATAGVRIKLVAVEDIYDQFGFGMLSPQAIRDYLRFAYENYVDPAPSAVLLLGDGTYDFLNNLNVGQPSYDPPFLWAVDNSAGDDNYVYFGEFRFLDSDSSYAKIPGDRGWDMMTARWPVKSRSDVSHFIDKLKSYESDDAVGMWRSRVTFVADDEFKDDRSNEIIHTAQSETLAVYHTPPEFIHNKIYLTDYQFASTGDKPAVNDAIVKAVNDGTLILNYIGHGSRSVWADEHVLRTGSDLSRFHNPDKLFVVIAASCSIGFFDEPADEGMAELMFRQDGGAIATVSAVRLVYARDNAMFNYLLYDLMFSDHMNLAEAVYTAKVIHQYPPYLFDYSLQNNDRSYVVFGDPFMNLGIPEYRIQFAMATDSLQSLAPVTVTGQIVDDDGLPLMIAGVVNLEAFDSRTVKQHELGIEYSLSGPSIYRGTENVVDGQFAASFVVPLDIDYGGNTARISGYAALDGTSAIGAVDSLSIASSPAASDDKTGPEIAVSFIDIPEFRSGDRIPDMASMEVHLADNSGINVTGGLGHQIELIIDDDNTSKVDITDRFAYEPGSYQIGTAAVQLPELEPGMHTFRIRAWDNANNPADYAFEASTSRAGLLAIEELLNWPNPMDERTEFFFTLTEPTSSVRLQIFTLSGRKIREFESSTTRVGANRLFTWDGRDNDGDRVAEGVYIFKLIANGAADAGIDLSGSKAEAYGKLVLRN